MADKGGRQAARDKYAKRIERGVRTRTNKVLKRKKAERATKRNTVSKLSKGLIRGNVAATAANVGIIAAGALKKHADKPEVRKRQADAKQRATRPGGISATMARQKASGGKGTGPSTRPKASGTAAKERLTKTRGTGPKTRPKVGSSVMSKAKPSGQPERRKVRGVALSKRKGQMKAAYKHSKRVGDGPGIYSDNARKGASATSNRATTKPAAKKTNTTRKGPSLPKIKLIAKSQGASAMNRSPSKARMKAGSQAAKVKPKRKATSGFARR